MLERDVIKTIKDNLWKTLGVRAHKTHGGPFSEIGEADLHFTLPDGRAGYAEVKRPGASVTSQHVLLQLRWLSREAEMGAFTACVSSWDELAEMLRKEGYKV